MLYVFVDIKVDLDHFIKTVQHNFTIGSKIAMVSTVQFLSTLQVVLSEVKLFIFICDFETSFV